LGRGAEKRFPGALEFYQSGARLRGLPGRSGRATSIPTRRKVCIEPATAGPARRCISRSMEALLVSIVVVAPCARCASSPRLCSRSLPLSRSSRP